MKVKNFRVKNMNKNMIIKIVSEKNVRKIWEPKILRAQNVREHNVRVKKCE